MNENIRIDLENKEVHLSNDMNTKIRNLIKRYSFSNKVIDNLNNNIIDYNTFICILENIIRYTKIICDISVNRDNRTQLDHKLDEELKDICQKYLEQYVSKNIIYIYKNNDDIENLINLSYEIKNKNNQIYLLRDLIRAKEDYIKDMKYFMNEESINNFNNEYSNAIEAKDTNKMLEMLKQVQKLILKEWENYTMEIDNMTDENFCFLGHSTSTTEYKGEFNSKYVSCSLLTQNVYETYRSGFGFIVKPTNIVGASSSDMYVNNNSLDEEDLLSYSSISQIHHPKRIIDECKEQKEENIKNNSLKKVYNEVVIDGFEPIGIFCFTNGTKNLDRNYKSAIELQKKFPNLKIKFLDMMKIKKEKELENMQLYLINYLSKKLLSNNYDIKQDNLPRYKLFLQKFEGLKKLDNYTEEEIENLFKYNASLLSIFHNDPDNLFKNNYNDEEIKYILGNNILYNIDFILKGDITIYSLQKLKEQEKNKDKLNKYYDGLGEFVSLLSKVDIDNEIIEEIKKDIPINFYKMSKCLLNKISKKEKVIESEIDKLKKEYQDLIKEQEERLKLEEQEKIYHQIILNEGWYKILENDFNYLTNIINENNQKIETLLIDKENIENQINNIEKDNEEIINNYQNKINNLKEKQSKLRKHSILNFIKIRKNNNEINKIENEKNNTNKNINNNTNIQLLKIQLQNIEFELTNIKERKNNPEQELNNINNKIYKYFKCNSFEEVATKIKESKEFLEKYDYSNKYILKEIERKIEKIENEILDKENLIEDIKEDKKNISK